MIERVCRWQVDAGPGAPEHNMAMDSALLTALAEGHETGPTIRLYQWDRPAVSIGRHQTIEAVQRFYPGLPIVRRPTGGRAVLHGTDLTISIAAPTDWLPEGSGHTILSSYHRLMRPLASALEQTGHAVCYGTERTRGQSNVVDCFEASAVCDLVDRQTGKKLVGSAQRREKNALLQQISLPLQVLDDKEHFLHCLQHEYTDHLRIQTWQTSFKLRDLRYDTRE